jgi:hypothetical protein
MLVQVNAFPAGRLEACAPTNPTYGPNFVEMSGYGKVPTDNWNFNYFASSAASTPVRLAFLFTFMTFRSVLIMHFAFIDPNKMARTSVVIIFEVFIFRPQTTKYQGKPHRPVEISSVFQAILKEASFRVFKTALEIARCSVINIIGTTARPCDQTRRASRLERRTARGAYAMRQCSTAIQPLGNHSRISSISSFQS